MKNVALSWRVFVGIFHGCFPQNSDSTFFVLGKRVTESFKVGSEESLIKIASKFQSFSPI